MLRVVLGGVLAAAVVFGYLMASWMVLDLHRGTIRPLPDSWREAISGEGQSVHSGVYAAPMPPPNDATVGAEEQQREWNEFLSRHRRGPLVTVFYHREGSEPFHPMILAMGLAVDLVAAWIAGLILYLGRSAFHVYVMRVAIVTLLGLFTGVVAHGGYFVWMQFDLWFTVVMAGDVIASWFLASLVLAAIVKELPSDATDRRPLLRPPGVEIKPPTP